MDTEGHGIVDQLNVELLAIEPGRRRQMETQS
jgi:hypothetical protein